MLDVGRSVTEVFEEATTIKLDVGEPDFKFEEHLTSQEVFSIACDPCKCDNPVVWLGWYCTQCKGYFDRSRLD